MEKERERRPKKKQLFDISGGPNAPLAGIKLEIFVDERGRELREIVAPSAKKRRLNARESQNNRQNA